MYVRVYVCIYKKKNLDIVPNLNWLIRPRGLGKDIYKWIVIPVSIINLYDYDYDYMFVYVCMSVCVHVYVCV